MLQSPGHGADCTQLKHFHLACQQLEFLISHFSSVAQPELRPSPTLAFSDPSWEAVKRGFKGCSGHPGSTGVENFDDDELGTVHVGSRCATRDEWGLVCY